MTYFFRSTPTHEAVPTTDLGGYNVFNPNDLSQALQQVHLNTHDPQWYMDSGASSHLTADQGKITTPLFSSPVNSIFVGDGKTIPIHGSGNSTHKLQNQTYRLNNILFTPNIIKNLLSVRKFTIDNNTSVEFDPFGFSVKDLKSGVLLSRHNSSGELYHFTSPPIASACHSTTTDQWHNWLSHPSESILDLLHTCFSIHCNKAMAK